MKKKILAGLVAVLLVYIITGVAIATPIQWKIADGGNGHWYDIFESTTGIYFDEAKASAVAMGGYLATPDLPGEPSFIFNNLVAPTAKGSLLPYWLGAYSEGSAEAYQWKWVTGGLVTAWGGYAYIDWSSGAGWHDYSGPQGLVQVPNNGWTSGDALQDMTLITPASGFVVEFVNLPTVNKVPLSSNPLSIFLLVIGIISASVGMQRKYTVKNKV